MNSDDMVQSADYYPARNWGQPFSGEMNFSVYIFRSHTQSTKYSLGDRPLAHVAVELRDSTGKTISWTRSNVNGFANFVASKVRPDADIKKSGQYTISIICPPRWNIVAGQSIQELEIIDMQGAPADLANLNDMTPVGLTPTLAISGAYRDKSRGEVSVPHVSPMASQVAAVPNDPIFAMPSSNSRFSIPAHPGLWKLENPIAGHASERIVTVKQHPVEISGSVKSTPFLEEDLTSTEFDDLEIGDGLMKLPNGYLGLEWNNLVGTHNKLYGGEGYVNATIGGSHVAYNGSGHPASISRSKIFNFKGGYFGAAWFHTEGEILKICGWHAEELTYSHDMPLSALGPTYFDADYKNVTKVTFATENYWQFVTGRLEFILESNRAVREG